MHFPQTLHAGEVVVDCVWLKITDAQSGQQGHFEPGQWLDGSKVVVAEGDFGEDGEVDMGDLPDDLGLLVSPCVSSQVQRVSSAALHSWMAAACTCI